MNKKSKRLTFYIEESNLEILKRLAYWNRLPLTKVLNYALYALSEELLKNPTKHAQWDYALDKEIPQKPQQN